MKTPKSSPTPSAALVAEPSESYLGFFALPFFNNVIFSVEPDAKIADLANACGVEGDGASARSFVWIGAAFCVARTQG